MAYPHNLMVQRSRRKDVIKGSLLFGGMVLLIVALFVLSGPGESVGDTTVIVCPGNMASPNCHIAHN